ncbi:N-acetyltransferase [Bacillus pseudomycoides]|uniref:GNAT family N-acetyltransferase n=1 Tax=Bacillus TaxID=1386 RepID=UPI0001A1958F|nr:GNAT family N-acetyltransferase [Bacillus pseudomycoides]EEM13857.1 acetyltransferase [Bacillus pseudomycoides DSM 12442]MED1597527.1 GNAT family N-acetyltransferase [Bacillus pseudomycoides]MED4712607.1 GNAT family N-acetyltransferase [Bacillus pseudomycoides]OOR48382.1 N-acetyltransferase [Bacillus pseudomycoides]PDX97537.1 N-acetyltransferase [Bacillus pseudomycoides]
MNHDEKFTVIKAGLNELDLVTRLFDKYRIFYKQTSNLKEAKKFIQERMENDDSVIFLAFENQIGDVKPLGFVQLYPSFSSVAMKKLWNLNDLYVEQSARQKGVAKALMEKAKEYALETGAKGLTLETAIDNYNAQSLYESMGYEKDDECFHYNFFLK